MFLDTAGLLSYLDATESRHQEAVKLFRDAPHWLTHNYVMAELVPLCRARRVNRTLVLAFLGKLLDSPATDVVWVDRSLHESALSFLRARADKDYSLCDAVSFLLMRQRGITEALTTDHHFEREGFVRLLRP